MTTKAEVREAAREAVERYPQIEAVLLFGSRARGDHHDWSDWDVVIVAEGLAYSHESIRSLTRLDQVNAAIMNRSRIEARKDEAGTLESNVARQAKVLAGSWKRPKCRKGGLDVDETSVLEKVTDAVRKISDAYSARKWAIGEQRAYDAHMVQHVQMAGEFLAKSIVSACGVNVSRVHDMLQLGNELEAGYEGGRFSREEVADLAEGVRSLDGNSNRAHVALYFKDEVETPERTREKLRDTMELGTRWLKLYGEKSPDSREEAARRADTARRLAERERLQADFGNIETELQDAMKKFEKGMARIAAEWGPEDAAVRMARQFEERRRGGRETSAERASRQFRNGQAARRETPTTEQGTSRGTERE